MGIISRRIQVIFLICILWFVDGVDSAWARSDEEVRAAIEDVLIQRHPRDTPQWWRGLGENAPSVIIEMYPARTKIYHRVRLVEALGNFEPTREVLEFLKSQAGDSTEDVIRNSAVYAIGRSAAEKEIDFLENYLAHKDPHTRFAAARAFTQMKGARPKEILERYRSNEKATWIIAKLDDTRPTTVSLLQPVASNSDATLSPLLGDWEGVWIAPAPKAEGGKKRASPYLVSGFRLVARAKNGKVEAEVVITHPEPSLETKKRKALDGMTIKLKTFETLEKKVFASISENPFSTGEDSTGAVWEFRGDLVDYGSLRQIELVVPKSGARWLLRPL